MKETKKIGAKLVIAWVFSILFIVGGIGILLENPFPGVLVVLSGVIILPVFNKLLKEKVNIELSTWLKVLTILVLLAIAGYSIPSDTTNLNTNTNTDNINQNNQVPSNTQKTWHEVKTFSGTSDKKTEPFNIQGERFKITYTVNQANDYSVFYLFVYEPGNNIYIESFSLDSGIEESISYAGPGEYYLDIGAANLNSWIVKIEDYY